MTAGMEGGVVEDGDSFDRLFARLGAEMKRCRDAAGLGQQRLAVKIGFHQSQISKAERGHTFPPAALVEATDETLKAGGVLVEAYAKAWQARRAEGRPTRRAATPEGALVEPHDHARGLRQTEQVEQFAPDEPFVTLIGQEDTTDADRRGFFRATGLIGAGAAAAEVSRRIARADPDPYSLDELEASIDRVAGTYMTTPHTELVPRMEAGWQDAELLLETTRLSSRSRKRITLVAGQHAFYRGLAAFDMGDDPTARVFLVLADQHADDVGDLLLTGSVAAIRSSVAYFNGRDDAAADIAARARREAHPYTRPILAGCEARAAARAGRSDQALTALADMQEHIWSGEILPGPNPGGEDFAHAFLAVVYSQIGRGELAEPHALESLAMLDGTDRFVQIFGTHRALATSFLRRKEPDPEHAAANVTKGLSVVGGRGAARGVQAAGQLWKDLHRSWPELPAVRELGAHLDATRRALPPGKSV
jgi:transcriptional regulator with XRE-family HTH domain